MGHSLTKHCAICNCEFTGSSEQTDLSHWCNTFPSIMSEQFNQQQHCQSCLAQSIVQRIKASIRSNGIEKVIGIARPYFNPGNLIEHIDYTIEQGNYVFSSWYHLKRGTCCDSGCRNCPYKGLRN